jgi:4-hydroxyacetophenone monooxygenase
MHSYFKNPNGEIHTVSPWKLYEYHEAVREPQWADFVLRATESVAAQR